MARQCLREALEADSDYRTARRPISRNDLEQEEHTHALRTVDRCEALATSDFSRVRERAAKVLIAHGYTAGAARTLDQDSVTTEKERSPPDTCYHSDASRNS